MKFRILGPVGLQKNGAIRTIRGSRQRTLLTLLLINPGTVVTKTQLFDELWGDQLPDGVDNALQALVTRFRRTLQDTFGESVGQRYLITRPSGYLLDVEPDSVDLQVFERLTAQARSILRTDPVTAAGLLDQALALWQGPALQGVVGGHLCQSAAEQFEEARLAAVEDRIRVNIALGGPATAISELKMLAFRHPLRERFFELLMLCMYRTGRQAEAVQIYTHLRRRLIDELGMEPSPGLQRLMASILKHDPTLGRHQPPASV